MYAFISDLLHSWAIFLYRFENVHSIFPLGCIDVGSCVFLSEGDFF